MISVVGNASAAAATVALPAHQVGDMIIVVARRANNTAASVPAPGGTVPVYQSVQSAGANTVALTTVAAVATANNHTCGTFTNADQIIVIIVRTDQLGVDETELRIGGSATGNGNNAGNIVYPALTLQAIDGTSAGVRAAARGAAPTNAAIPNWTIAYSQPSGATSLLNLAVRIGLVANIVADTVTQAPNAAFRAHTVEVREWKPTAPGAPRTVAGVPGVRSATVSWLAPLDNGGRTITGYTVTPYIGATPQTPISAGTSLNTAISDLLGGTAYTFRVTATNSIGTGPEGISGTVTPTGVNPPGAPRNVTAQSIGGGRAEVTWEAPLSDGGGPITGYTVTPSPSGDPVTVTGLSAIITGLGSEYTFTVVAMNEGGTSPASAPTAAIEVLPAARSADLLWYDDAAREWVTIGGGGGDGGGGELPMQVFTEVTQSDPSWLPYGEWYVEERNVSVVIASPENLIGDGPGQVNNGSVVLKGDYPTQGDRLRITNLFVDSPVILMGQPPVWAYPGIEIYHDDLQVEFLWPDGQTRGVLGLPAGKTADLVWVGPASQDGVYVVQSYAPLPTSPRYSLFNPAGVSNYSWTNTTMWGDGGAEINIATANIPYIVPNLHADINYARRSLIWEVEYMFTVRCAGTSWQTLTAGIELRGGPPEAPIQDGAGNSIFRTTVRAHSSGIPANDWVSGYVRAVYILAEHSSNIVARPRLLAKSGADNWLVSRDPAQTYMRNFVVGPFE